MRRYGWTGLAAGAVAIGVAGAVAFANGVGTVTDSAVVVSGPNQNSTTQAAAGDQAQWVYEMDAQNLANPSQTTTVQLGGSHQLVPGTVEVPTGMTVEYSADGTTYGASGSSASRYVRVSGPVATDPGVAVGMSGPSVQSIPSSGGGDGYIPTLTDTRVFNVFHHVGARIVCFTIATGSLCPGYPRNVTVGGTQPKTGHASIAWVDEQRGRLWVPAQRMDAGHELEVGFVCLVVGDPGATPSDCGWRLSGTTAQTASNTGSLHSGAMIGGRMFAIDREGQIHCLDPAASGGTGDICSGYPKSLGLPAATYHWWTSLSPVGDTTRLIARTNSFSGANPVSTLACFDTATDAACSGWGGNVTVSNARPGGNDFKVDGDVIPMQSAGSGWDAFCVNAHNNGGYNPATLTIYCYNLADGTSATMPAGLDTTIPNTSGWYFGEASTGRPATSGNRVYFGLVRLFSQGDRFVCYDYDTDSVCPNFPYNYPSILRTYGMAVDTTGTCLWTLGDVGQLTIGSTTDYSQPCATSATATTVTPTAAYCGSSDAGGTWDAVNIRGIATSDYATATLTIRNGNGAIVSGFNAIPVPMSQSVDISGVSTSGATNTLKVSIAFGGITPSAFASGLGRVEVTWAGSTPPRFCLETVPVTSCATAQNLTTTASSRYTDGLTAGSLIANSQTLTRTDPQPADCAEVAVTVEACTSGTPASCTVGATGVWQPASEVPPGTSATFRVTAENTGTANLAGVTATALTIAACNRNIGSFAASATQQWVCSDTVPGSGVAERVTVAGTATCPTEGCRTVSLQSSPASVTVIAPPAPAPLTTNGQQGATQTQVIPIPPGGSVTLLDGSTPTNTVTFAGQGTYTLNPGTGELTFVPAGGFVGTAPAVTYEVTDAFGRSASATYTAVVLDLANTGSQIRAIVETGSGAVLIGLLLVRAAMLRRRRS